MTTLLSTQLRGRPCRVSGSDLRIRVRATGLGTYPDASVICGKVQFDPHDASKTTAVNPRVVIEVLSPSTEQYDRGEKLDHYKKIPSLEDVVVISCSTRRIEVWRREKRGWRCHASEAGVAELQSLKCELSVAEVYRDPLAG